MARIALLIISLLLLSMGSSLGASQCPQESSVAASLRRQARASQNSMMHSPSEGSCRAYLERFIEAVAARRNMEFCQDGVERRRALEALEAELQAFNDRIAEHSCVQ